MNNSVFNEELLEKSNIIGVHFSVEQMEQFYKYMNLLIEWNEKMNLTAIIEPEEIIQKHFILTFCTIIIILWINIFQFNEQLFYFTC